MNHKTFRSSLLLTAMFAASAAFANSADIVKCVDQDGRVTLTDNQCSAGVQTVVVAASAEAPATQAADAHAVDPAAAAPAPARRVTRMAFTPMPIQHDSWSAPRGKSRMLARDVETLKAARLSMQVLDQASASTRQQRVALN
ncbi:DUF4124 domain-containing protein [Massilia sp. TWR1-2-2]|uniref:DUF4124 domain-containing protein n=1 Tax=Massilia sp. TWR1-2-2 TaxID=2804584 RepID=UPI003CE77258